MLFCARAQYLPPISAVFVSDFVFAYFPVEACGFELSPSMDVTANDNFHGGFAAVDFSSKSLQL